MKRAGIRFALILAGVLCWLSAAGLAAHNALANASAKKAASDTLAVLTQAIPEPHPAAQKDEIVQRFEPAAEKAEETTLKTQIVDGRYYAGIVEIPSRELRLPVLSSWSYDGLRVSPCVYSGSPYTDDLVICAHNYYSFFNDLLWVDMGAEVLFTTADGEQFRYVIANRETLDPSEIGRMTEADGKWDLTLFTCWPGGATRCTIRCERTG